MVMRAVNTFTPALIEDIDRNNLVARRFPVGWAAISDRQDGRPGLGRVFDAHGFRNSTPPRNGGLWASSLHKVSRYRQQYYVVVDIILLKHASQSLVPCHRLNYHGPFA